MESLYWGSKMTERRIINTKECCQITGFSRQTIYNLIKAGKFPKPFKLGQKTNSWLYEDIIKWLDDRIKSS